MTGMNRRWSAGSSAWSCARARVIRVLAITAVLLVSFHVRVARADNIAELIKQLEDDSDKIRLAATLNLTKLGDERALLPMVKLLANDSVATVRGAAAVGVAKLVTANTKPGLRNLVISSLAKVVANDSSDFVKQQATKSLTALGASSGGGTQQPSTGTNGIYVNIGPMSSKTGVAATDPKMRGVMAKVATQTLSKVASSMATSWAGGGVPTGNQLTQKGFQGFYVDGTLNSLTIKTTGSSATVSCKISMLLASFPDKAIFGLLSGGANVQGSASPKDIELASEDCVTAVVEDLIAKKIVPTIKTKASP